MNSDISFHPVSVITRRSLLCAAVTVATAVGRDAIASPAGKLVEVNPRIVYQTFEGWGTSIAWWGHVVGGFSAEIRHDYLTRIFHPSLGLGLTVARYNIGGGENPRYHYLTYRAAIPGYNRCRASLTGGRTIGSD